MIDWLISGIIGSILGVLANEIVHTAKRRVANNTERRFWQFIDQKTAIFISNMGFGRTGVLGGSGDWIATVEIVRTISKHYPKTNVPIYFPDMNLAKDLNYAKHKEENLIVIGGPLYNAVARDILTNIRCPLGFNIDSYAIESVDGAQKYDPIIEDGSVKKDVGLIVRAKNPYALERTVIVLAGSHSYGTSAAAQYLLKKGYKHFVSSKDRNIALVVTASVTDHEVQMPRLISAEIVF